MMRKLVPFEKSYLVGNIYVHLAMRFKDKKAVDKNLEKLSNFVSALHSKTDGENLYFEKQEVPVFTIPSNIKNLLDQCNYVAHNNLRPHKDALASLSVSNDSIVLAANHSILDGGGIKYVYETICDEKETPPPSMSKCVFEPFYEQMKSTKYDVHSCYGDPKATRYFVKDTKELYYDSNLAFSRGEIKFNQMQIYDKKSRKVHGLSEAFFAAMILSMCAQTGDFSKKGLCEVFGTRPLIKDIRGYEQGLFVTSFPVSAEADRDTTIKEFMKRLRADLNYQISHGAHFATMRNFNENINDELVPGFPLIMSSLGDFKVHGPVTDACVFTNGKTNPAPFGYTSFLLYSLTKGNESTMKIHSHYIADLTSRRENLAFMKACSKFLTEIPLTAKCGDALDILSEYQNNIIKNNSKVCKTF
ncbi:hypothetical protein M9Y10_002997 [Tritrichomonas musculus]|uniref:Condensation domain-containing protein n=1 Tax=Tritrichomonas musculus TaxID=1915356 RepID=A0ABR2LBB8_9EUKA